MKLGQRRSFCFGGFGFFVFVFIIRQIDFEMLMEKKQVEKVRLMKTERRLVRFSGM